MARVVFTQHAERMLAERNIRHDWVLDTIFRHDVVEADPHPSDRLLGVSVDFGK
jgi:hypothetical protein